MQSNPCSHTACIGLGSNLGNSLQNLLAAWQQISQHPDITALRLSSPYITKPFEMKSEHLFVNAVALLVTNLSAEVLLQEILEIEKKQGRTRSGAPGYQDRNIDIDLLLFDDLVMETQDLILPHPHMHRRLFVLEPLREIAPELVHPGLGKCIDELHADLISAERGNAVQQVVERHSWNDGNLT